MVEDDDGEVDEGVFVVAGGDAAPSLQACEAPFDGVSTTLVSWLHLPHSRRFRNSARASATSAFWWPYVAEILERHDLTGAGREPVVGFNATYPTFLYGDVAVKVFGYSRSWRESHAAERAAQALIATGARDLDEEVRWRVVDEVDARLANPAGSKPRRPTPNRKVTVDRSFHAVTSSVSHCGFTPGQGDARARW